MCTTPVATASLTPRELAQAKPSAAMVSALEAVDWDALSADDRLYLVEAWDRVASWVAARSHRAVAAFAGPGGPEPDGSPDQVLCREDLAAALRLGSGTAQARIDQARALAALLPGTLALLEAGEVSARHAAVVVDACQELTAGQAAAVEAKVLPKAPSLTVGELRSRLRAAVAAADPKTFEQAHAAAAAKRCVVLYPERDGMATLLATLPAADAQTVFLALDAAARAAAADQGGGRAAEGVDARRADALVAFAATYLASPGAPLAHGRRVAVQVTVDLPTLLGLADHPADLAGYGPVPASVAQALAADGAWRRLVTDPVTGHLLDYGQATYRPPQALKDYLVARDQRCQFPGCGQPAYRGELDHVTPYGRAGGRTSAHGMCTLCKRHHQAKTSRRWHLKRHTSGGLQWTSPTGRTYDVEPKDHRPESA
jgi:Domain of unknown function (DUF222)